MANTSLDSDAQPDATEALPLAKQLQMDLDPERPCLDRFVATIRYYTAAVALVMAIVACVAFFRLKMTMLDNIMNVYIILFCILAVLTETNLRGFTEGSKILRVWLFRGALYFFIGVLGLNALNSTVVVHEGQLERVLFRSVMAVFSWMMTALGILYMTMGVLCFQIVHANIEKRYQENKERAVLMKEAVEQYGTLSAYTGDGVV